MFQPSRLYRTAQCILLFFCFLVINAETTPASMDLPAKIEREELIQTSKSILGQPKIEWTETEDVFRINEVGMDWDIGVMVYEPKNPAQIPTGADKKKVGIFLTHGGSGDWRAMEKLARLLAGTYGYKIINMTYPGRLYLQDPSRDWPGDTYNPDGTARTPIWKKDELITPDQYEVVKDVSMRARYGTRLLAKAKKGSLFYNRMAGWPVAFEQGMKEACKRHFPTNEFSIYVHGHSTGGPFVFMLCQRVENIAGVLAIENSPFGYINEEKHAWSGSLGKIGEYGRVTTKRKTRYDPFNELYLRSWRDKARYYGPEILGKEGPKALMRLPMVMEEVLAPWDKSKKQPQFKCEYLVTHNIIGSLKDAAHVTADRLGLSAPEKATMVERYIGYTRELSGPGVKPVPPVLFGITKDSRDHSMEVYQEVILPCFAAMDPAPKTHLVHYMAGVHGYTSKEKDLPMGIGPALIQVWHNAITGGWFVE